MRSPRTVATRQRLLAAVSRTNHTCTTDRLIAQFLGWTKWTPSITESRISRCVWPTTTTSGCGVMRANAAASFSGPIPVVS